MSKPVKNLIERTYRARFADVDSAVMIDLRGIPAVANSTLRSDLAKHEITITMVKNSLARRAWRETALEPLGDLLDGSCTVAVGGTAVEMARLLLEHARTVNLTFRGALMEGELFGPDQIDALSKYPTRTEAQGQVLQTALSAGGQLISAVDGAGAQLMSILDALEERLKDDDAVEAAA